MASIRLGANLLQKPLHLAGRHRWRGDHNHGKLDTRITAE